MTHYKKIAILGSPGSGKSTLAFHLNKKLNIPVFHLDQYYWKPGWKKTDKEDFKKAHDQICAQDRWIIDGNAGKISAPRLQNADLIILLDIPRWKCLYNVFKRTIIWWNTQRPDSAPGCKDGLSSDLKLLFFMIWNFPSKKQKILEMLTQYPNKKIVILRSQNEISEFIKSI